MKIFTLLALLSFGFFAKAQSIEAGLWKTETLMVVNGLPLPNPESEECISEGIAKDVKTRIEQELNNKGCELATWNISGTSVAASITCRTNVFRAKGKLAGQFTTKNYDIRGEAQGFVGLLPAAAKVSLKGLHLGDCRN